MTFYTILTRTFGTPWVPQFSSSNHNDPAFELASSVSDEQMLVVATQDKQSSLLNKVAMLNAVLVNDGLILEC